MVKVTDKAATKTERRRGTSVWGMALGPSKMLLVASGRKTDRILNKNIRFLTILETARGNKKMMAQIFLETKMFAILRPS